MKNKINSRLIMIALIAIISTVIGITAINYSLFQKQVRTDLSLSATLLKDTHYFESNDIDTNNIDLSADNKDLRVTWIDTDGTVLYDNDASTSSLSNHLDRPEIKEAFEKGSGEIIRRSDTMNQNTFYYALLLENGTVLRVATNASSLWSVFLSVAPITILIILLIVLMCVMISRILTKQLLKPIETMAQNLENRDYESPYKELDPLSKMLKRQHADILLAAKARQDFTANVSHELKTPLTAISGYAELLEGDMVEQNKKSHFYHEIKRNADRLLALINDIIKLSELDRMEHKVDFEEFDLFELVNDNLEVYRMSAQRKNIKITLKGEKSLIRGDRDMIKELVDNLVSNAIRYNDDNGLVEIEVNKKDQQTVLSVKDNGIGIHEDEQDRVFERFYRVDKSRSKATGGTGLGLAIVKHIVEIHEGKIKLESKPKEGTVIEVYF